MQNLKVTPEVVDAIENMEYNVFTDMEESWVNYFLMRYDMAQNDTEREKILNLVKVAFRAEKHDLVCKILTGQA